jgi:hypothetical protein
MSEKKSVWCGEHWHSSRNGASACSRARHPSPTTTVNQSPLSRGFQFTQRETQELRAALEEALREATHSLKPIKCGWGRTLSAAQPWTPSVSEADWRSFVRLLEHELGLHIWELAQQLDRKGTRGRPPTTDSRIRLAQQIASKTDTVLGLRPTKARLTTWSIENGKRIWNGDDERLDRASGGSLFLARVLHIALRVASERLGGYEAPEDLSRLLGPAVDYTTGDTRRPRGGAVRRGRAPAKLSVLDLLLRPTKAKKR